MTCPISHKTRIKHPVVIKNVNEKTTFEAEYLVQWLKHHRMIDPVSHRPIKPGLARHILKPHGGAEEDTKKLLIRAGYLDGRGGKVFFSIGFNDLG